MRDEPGAQINIQPTTLDVAALNAISPHTGQTGCGCTACADGRDPEQDTTTSPLDGNIDGTGGTVNGKPVWTIEQVAAHLNRTGSAWTPGPNNPTPNSGSAAVISFGFFQTQDQVFENGYGYEFGGQFFAFNEYFNFAAFSEAQREATRLSIQAWDDLIATTFVETSADDADINFGNLLNAPNTQAYAYLPAARLTANPDINAQIREIAGDVWVSPAQASNLQLAEGQYGIHTLTHEVGHAIGLSHPGAYNAAPGLNITYGANAEYAQDTRAYSVMSYFQASALGARHFDFNISTIAYAATPLIHDIAAAQRIYGADMTTRTGNTVYGFNSNAGRNSYDFSLTPAPIMAIWDAGGIDTIDASGYDTKQLIDLTPGSLSSIGGVTIDSAPTFEETNANRAAVGLPPILLATYTANMNALRNNPEVGRLTDNVGIAYGAIIENAIGGSGSDLIIGNAVDNVLTGNAGDDFLYGNAGNDTLVGGLGNDFLDGGTGNDLMTGGDGNDVYVVDSLGDRIVEANNGGIDEVRTTLDSYRLGSTLENLTGLSATGQTLIGNAGANAIRGGVGGDTIDGGSGDDFIDGGLGDDVITGGSGDDVMFGGDGNDSINGGSGDDFLIGGAGDDVLTGGSGSDTFVLGPGFGNDRITDFRAGDVLDWSAMTEAGFEVITTQVGRDTLISFSDGSSVLLERASASAFRGDWFIDDEDSAFASMSAHADWALAA